MSNLPWPPILERAAEIVRCYDTEVSLRQLFYRLVAEEWIPNTLHAYNRLGRLSAQGRREGWFPRLFDAGRRIHRPLSFESPEQALTWLGRVYRRDRTKGQPYSLYVGVEKATWAPQLEAWFEDWGLPVVALRGYSGQELVTDMADDIVMSSRPAVLVYAGDLDPDGEHLDRDFVRRVAGFAQVERVALSMEQVAAYDLPPQLGNADWARAADFVKRHGRLVQVELEALPPDVLRALYEEALGRWWDVEIERGVRKAEAADAAELEARRRRPGP